MRILLAAADRDFLSAYAQILGSRFGEVVTAFDAAMALNSAEEGEFDLAVADQRLPRIPLRTMIGFFYSHNIPAVVITYWKQNIRLLTEDIPAAAFLPLPFEPDRLIQVMEETAGRFGTDEGFHAADVFVEPGKLKMENRFVTLEEARFLRAAAEGDDLTLASLSTVYADSLNRKISSLGKKARIRYVNGQGFRLEAGS